MPTIKIWGFSNSPFVRAVRMVLAEKGVFSYEQIAVNVFTGDHKSPDHLARHPFGKIPVVEVDGFRVIETVAIARYLDAVLPGVTLVPAEPKNAARMDMAISILDKYGSNAINWGVLGYHLFPQLIGGKDDAQLQRNLADSMTVMGEIMRIKGDDPWIAGPEISIADLMLAPTLYYVTTTPAKDEFLQIPGVAEWWQRVSHRDSFLKTAH